MKKRYMAFYGSEGCRFESCAARSCLLLHPVVPPENSVLVDHMSPAGQSGFPSRSALDARLPFAGEIGLPASRFRLGERGRRGGENGC